MSQRDKLLVKILLIGTSDANIPFDPLCNYSVPSVLMNVAVCLNCQLRKVELVK
jgi:hypothetical protein